MNTSNNSSVDHTVQPIQASVGSPAPVAGLKTSGENLHTSPSEEKASQPNKIKENFSSSGSGSGSGSGSSGNVDSGLYREYAQEQTEIKDENRANVYNAYVFPNITSTVSTPAVCVSNKNLTLIGSEQSDTSCKYNASMKYSEYNQQIKMRKMTAKAGLSYRVLGSYDTPNANTFAFTGMFTSPSGAEITNLYDKTNPLIYNAPAGGSKTMNIKLSDIGVSVGSNFSVELFGYIIAKTTSIPTEVSVNVSGLDPTSYTVRTWFGTNAIYNYTTSTTKSSVKVYNGEMIPVRIQVYLKANATKIAQNTPEANTKYWDMYGDVKRARYPAWLHYDRHGRGEGRTWPNIKIVDNFQISVNALSQVAKSDDVIGLYTLLDENKLPYFMNKYLYGLSGKDCYSASVNTQPEDVKYVLAQLYEVEVNPADLSNNIVSLTEITSGFKLKVGNAPEISQVFTGIIPQTNPNKSTGYSGSGDINKMAVFSNSRAYYMAKRQGTKTIVYGYLLNPKCDSSAKYPTTTDGVKMYNLDLTPFDNRYGTYNKEISVFHPLNDKESVFKKTALTMSGGWISLDNLYPSSLSVLSQIDKTTDATNCRTQAASKGASQAFFVKDSTNPKSVKNLCYYSTDIPAYGKVSLGTATRAPPANITSSLYIRTQSDLSGAMPKLSVSNYSIGNAYESTIAANKEWVEIANTQYNGESFIGRTEPFTEGATTLLEKGREASKTIYGWVDNNAVVNDANKSMADLNTSLTNLKTTADSRTTNTAVNNYTSADGDISYDEAKALYNLVHPNTQKNAIDGLEVDSNELRMQYNNMFMVGSIAAATFAIAAVVTLSLR